MNNYVSLVEDQFPAPIKQPVGTGASVSFEYFPFISSPGVNWSVVSGISTTFG